MDPDPVSAAAGAEEGVVPRIPGTHDVVEHSGMTPAELRLAKYEQYNAAVHGLCVGPVNQEVAKLIAPRSHAQADLGYEPPSTSGPDPRAQVISPCLSGCLDDDDSPRTSGPDPRAQVVSPCLSGCLDDDDSPRTSGPDPRAQVVSPCLSGCLDDDDDNPRTSAATAVTAFTRDSPRTSKSTALTIVGPAEQHTKGNHLSMHHSCRLVERLPAQADMSEICDPDSLLEPHIKLLSPLVDKMSDEFRLCPRTPAQADLAPEGKEVSPLLLVKTSPSLRRAPDIASSTSSLASFPSLTKILKRVLSSNNRPPASTNTQTHLLPTSPKAMSGQGSLLGVASEASGLKAAAGGSQEHVFGTLSDKGSSVLDAGMVETNNRNPLFSLGDDAVIVHRDDSVTSFTSQVSNASSNVISLIFGCLGHGPAGELSGPPHQGGLHCPNSGLSPWHHVHHTHSHFDNLKAVDLQARGWQAANATSHLHPSHSAHAWTMGTASTLAHGGAKGHAGEVAKPVSGLLRDSPERPCLPGEMQHSDTLRCSPKDSLPSTPHSSSHQPHPAPSNFSHTPDASPTNHFGCDRRSAALIMDVEELEGGPSSAHRSSVRSTAFLSNHQPNPSPRKLAANRASNSRRSKRHPPSLECKSLNQVMT